MATNRAKASPRFPERLVFRSATLKKEVKPLSLRFREPHSHRSSRNLIVHHTTERLAGL